MDKVLMWLIAESVSATFAIGAVVLAYNNIDGWGWMIFASILTTATISTSTKKDEQ